MIPKKPNEIFSYICHFIFAIVIASTYETATNVFMNPEIPYLSNTDSFISSLEIFLAYVAIISGWVGYTRSMIKWPHKNTKEGAFRFALDITILFCYFGLIESTHPQNAFQNYFLYWLTALFGLFLIWDIFKIKEYHEKNESKRNTALVRSFLKTIGFFLIIAIIIPIIYNTSLEHKTGVITDDIIYIIILGFTIFVLLAYRYLKWSVHLEPRMKTKPK